MTSFEEFAAELRAFDSRKEIINEIRREFRKPSLLAELRTRVRSSATALLPSSGGLGAWVAASTFGIQFRDVGRSAGLRVKMSRNKGKGRGKADLKQLDDAGAVRHPLYGDRRHWFAQRVAAQFFTRVWDQYSDRWIKAADDAFDRALDKIRKG